MKLKAAAVTFNLATILLALYLHAAPHAIISKLYVLSEQKDDRQNRIVLAYLNEAVDHLGQAENIFLIFALINFLMTLGLIAKSGPKAIRSAPDSSNR